MMLYLDPGTGSILIQLFIATITGIIIAITASFSKIKALFKKKRK